MTIFACFLFFFTQIYVRTHIQHNLKSWIQNHFCQNVQWHNWGSCSFEPLLEKMSFSTKSSRWNQRNWTTNIWALLWRMNLLQALAAKRVVLRTDPKSCRSMGKSCRKRWSLLWKIIIISCLFVHKFWSFTSASELFHQPIRQNVMLCQLHSSIFYFCWRSEKSCMLCARMYTFDCTTHKDCYLRALICVHQQKKYPLDFYIWKFPLCHKR
jgi:hypothetical protein